MVEFITPKPKVPGSNPGSPTRNIKELGQIDLTPFLFPELSMAVVRFTGKWLAKKRGGFASPCSPIGYVFIYFS